MPYKLGDRTLALDVPWEHNDIQYPANWLRLSNDQDRAELGIVWENAGAAWNQRFYWGYDADGNLIPKTYTDVKREWISITKDTANKLLQPSDWMVVRAAEGGTAMPSVWTTWRATIRTECSTMVAAIEATAEVGNTSPYEDFGRVQALQEYIEGSSYKVWTADPDSTSE